MYQVDIPQSSWQYRSTDNYVYNFRKGKESSCCPPFWLFSPAPFSSPSLPPVSCISPSDPWLVIVTHCRALVKYFTRLVVPSLGDGIVHCPGNGFTCRLPQERFSTFYIFSLLNKKVENLKFKIQGPWGLPSHMHKPWTTMRKRMQSWKKVVFTNREVILDCSQTER